MKKSFINKINRKHIQKISVLLLMFCLITGSLLIPGMAEISIAYSDQDIVITEVCPNPANTSLSSDPFEYFEIVNTSGEVIDLSTCRFQYGKDGFNSTSWYENPLFFHSQGSQLQPGDVFVFLVYSSATVTEGVGYASDTEIENTLSRFNSFYGCNIPSSNFGIAACNLSSSTDKHNNAVNLSNSDANATIRILGNNNLILAEVNYDSAAYNKNAYSIHFAYQKGGYNGIAAASKILGLGPCSPYHVDSFQTYNPNYLHLNDNAGTIQLSDSYVTGIRNETTPADLTAMFVDSERISVVKAEGTPLGDGEYVGTGCLVRLMSNSDIIDEVQVVVKGDIDGDGRVLSNDYLTIKQYTENEASLTGAYLSAADVNFSDTVTDNDYTLIKSYFTNTVDLYDLANIDIMSYNVYVHSYWNGLADEVSTLINNYSPDILGAQEVSNDWRGYLEPMLEYYGYSYIIGPGDDEPNEIFYKTERFTLIDNGMFWLSETPDEVSIAYSWNTECIRTCLWAVLEDKYTEKQFVFFSTHVDMGADANREGTKLILERMKSFDMPIVFVADFNMIEGSTGYNLIVDSQTSLVDTKKTARTTLSHGLSSHGYKDTITNLEAGLPIDHCFVSEDGFDVFSYQILHDKINGMYPSDHFPLLIKAAIE